MRNQKLWLFFLVVILGLLLAPVCLVWGIAAYHRSRAEAFLRDLTALTPGKSTFADLQRLEEAYVSEPIEIPGQSQDCTAQSCDRKFVFRNTPLSFIPGVKSVIFATVITVKDGRIMDAVTIYLRMPFSQWKTDRSSQTSIPSNMNPEFLYGIIDTAVRKEDSDGAKRSNVDSKGIPHLLNVRLGPLSDAVTRSRAYLLDLSCLARLRGCDVPSHIYPRGWESWPAPKEIEIQQPGLETLPFTPAIPPSS